MSVIEQAESLLANDQWHALEWAKCREILPGLVAECKRLNEWMIKNRDIATDLQYQLTDMEAEAALWQAVAVEERAKIIAYHQEGIEEFWWMLKEVEKIGRGRQSYRQQAAAALGQPRAWLMTEERITAIDEIIGMLEGALFRDAFTEEIVIIRAMLSEAKQ